MLPIYDKFFATPETIIHKTTFGHIKACNERHNLQCQFTDNLYNPCSVFFYAGNRHDEHILDELLNQVIDIVKGNKESILYLDTIIEDFVHFPFIIAINKLLDAGISSDKIKIITSYNPAESFRAKFFNEKLLADCNKVGHKLREFGKYPQVLNDLKNIEIFCYDGFSTSYVIHTNQNQPDLVSDFSFIKERAFEKHFSLLQKNSRYLRKLFHAYFISKGYDKLSYYSWHNIGEDSNWEAKEEKALSMFNIPFDKEKFMKPVFFDNVDEPGGHDEWSVPSVVKNNCALPIVVETCNIRDEADTLFVDSFFYKENYFLSEKTYKNFFYGLPFIHLGMPYIDMHLENMGYFTFRHLFEENKIPVIKNTDGILNDFNVLDNISKMSLDQLSNILNNKKIIDQCKHNKKMLGRLLPLKNFLKQLDKY